MLFAATVVYVSCLWEILWFSFAVNDPILAHCCVSRLRSILGRSADFTRCSHVQYCASRVLAIIHRCGLSAVTSYHEMRCRSWRVVQSGHRCCRILTTQPHFNRSMSTALIPQLLWSDLFFFTFFSLSIFTCRLLMVGLHEWIFSPAYRF